MEKQTKYKPQYKDLKFNSEKDFKKWLKEKTAYKIIFEDTGQDFLEWNLDIRGEVLHSDLQSSVWNGKIVDIKYMSVGDFLYLNDIHGGDMFLTHRVKEIKKIKSKGDEKKC